MKTVKIIITTRGASVDPQFNIYDNGTTLPGLVRCALVNVTEFDPPNGYDCTQIADDATEVTLVGVGGVCENILPIPILECTTTTTSSTSSTTSTSTSTSTTTTTTTAEPTTTTSTTTEPLYNINFYVLTDDACATAYLGGYIVVDGTQFTITGTPATYSDSKAVPNGTYTINALAVDLYCEDIIVTPEYFCSVEGGELGFFDVTVNGSDINVFIQISDTEISCTTTTTTLPD